MSVTLPNRIGYARIHVSDLTIVLERQERELKGTGVNQGCCAEVFSERTSGGDWPEREAAISACKDGDTLVVESLDRVAKSAFDLFKLLRRLEQKHVALRVLYFNGQPLDTSEGVGAHLRHIAAGFTEFERAHVVDRHRAGVQAAKASGRSGRPSKIRQHTDRIMTLYTEAHESPAKIAEVVDASVASVYRVIREHLPAKAKGQPGAYAWHFDVLPAGQRSASETEQTEDDHHLLKHRNMYYVVMEVPYALRSILGKRRLKHSLKTRDLIEARLRRGPVVNAFKATIEAARRKAEAQLHKH
jgi:DNA invertase Pin-like site-specific DNA recombinase